MHIVEEEGKTEANCHRTRSDQDSIPTIEQLKISSIPLLLAEDSVHTVEPGTVRVLLKPLGETSMHIVGIPLEEVLARQREGHPDLTVPLFYHEAGKAVRLHGGSVKGIFRIRGKIKDIKVVKEKIDCGEEIEEAVWKDTHLITTLMKAFLRELPTPILHFENYERFIMIDGELGSSSCPYEVLTKGKTWKRRMRR